MAGKINKYEYLTGKEMLPCNQSQATEQFKFHIRLQEKLFINKQKQLKSKEQNKLWH